LILKKLGGDIKSDIARPDPENFYGSEYLWRAQCGNSARWDLCGGSQV